MLSTPGRLLRKISCLSRALAVAIVAASAAPAAHASILYEFVPATMTTPPGAPYTTFSVIGALELSDDALADGAFDLADVLDFSFQVNNGFVFSLTANPSDPIPPQATGLVSGLGELTDGVFRHLTISDFLELTADGSGLWSGQFITDGSAIGCNQTAFPCQFTGTWEIVSVPEPASLALLAPGAIALAWFGRRRRAQAAR